MEREQTTIRLPDELILCKRGDFTVKTRCFENRKRIRSDSM